MNVDDVLATIRPELAAALEQAERDGGAARAKEVADRDAIIAVLNARIAELEKPGTEPPAPPKADVPIGFDVAVFDPFNAAKADPKRFEADLALAAGLSNPGTRPVCRMVVDAGWVTLDAKTFHWGAFDSVMSALVAAGHRLMFCVGGLPPELRENKSPERHAPPKDAAVWEAVAGAIFERLRAKYAGLLIAVEGGNENNWPPQGAPLGADPAKYVERMLVPVAKAKTKVLGADFPMSTTSFVITDGKTVKGSMPIPAFVDGIYAALQKAGIENLNAIGVRFGAYHPYAYAAGAVAGQIKAGAELRKQMEAHGDTVDGIWATECGAPSAAGQWKKDASDTTQRDAVLEFVKQWGAAPWGTYAALFHVRSFEEPERRDSGLSFHRLDGKPKPIVAEFKKAVSTL